MVTVGQCAVRPTCAASRSTYRLRTPTTSPNGQVAAERPVGSREAETVSCDTARRWAFDPPA